MTRFVCPAGHVIEAKGLETVRCDECEIVATWLNRRTGEVFTWTDEEEHAEANRALEDMMDEAFDNTFFNGGW